MGVMGFENMAGNWKGNLFIIWNANGHCPVGAWCRERTCRHRWELSVKLLNDFQTFLENTHIINIEDLNNMT